MKITMTRTRKWLLVLTAVAVASMAVPQALAHTTTTYYPAYWQVDLRPDLRFTTSWPTGAHRDRVNDAVAQWNGRGQPMAFDRGTDRSNVNINVCPTANEIPMTWTDIPDSEGALAYFMGCSYTSNPSRLASGNVVFDSSRKWYTGTGDAGDGFLNLFSSLGGEYDLWSVLTHELGHATGFAGPFEEGHFDSNESICDDNDAQHTMCPGLKAGTERKRSTEPHEEHTFDARY